VNEEKHAAAVTALSELMRSELEGDDPHRFKRIQNLSMITIALQREVKIKRVKDIQGRGNGIVINPIGGGLIHGLHPGYDAPDPYDDNVPDGGVAMGGMMMNGPVDQAGLLREAIRMFAPKLKADEQEAVMRRRTAWASEFSQLLDVRKQLSDPTVRIEKRDDLAASIQLRIESLSKLISGADAPADPDALTPAALTKDNAHALVPAHPVRRHQAAIPGQQDDRDDLRPLAAGNDRDEGAPEEIDLRQPDGQPMVLEDAG
jgi:hypothetical protein